MEISNHLARKMEAKSIMNSILLPVDLLVLWLSSYLVVGV